MIPFLATWPPQLSTQWHTQVDCLCPDDVTFFNLQLDVLVLSKLMAIVAATSPT